MDRFRIIFLVFILVESSRCFSSEIEQYMTQKVERLKARANRMYGEGKGDGDKGERSSWEYQLEDKLAYPRGDKQKLREISQLWSAYYSCCARSLGSLTAAGAVPASSVTAYTGAVVRLPCGLCLAPGDQDNVVWLYAKSMYSLTFVPLEERVSCVMTGGELVMYNVGYDDAGVYRCEVGGSGVGLVVLEVVDYDENYTVVKPSTSRGPYAAPATIDGSLIVVSAWSPWSECSRCGRVGRRRRYGICTVRLPDQSDQLEHFEELDTTKSDDYQLCEEGRRYLEAFPRGTWCRSRYLPECVKSRPAVRARSSEIMVAMCKRACTDKQASRRVGAVLQRNNGSAAVYWMVSQVPPAPPPPAPALLLVLRNRPALIRCPGTTIRDMPVTWSVGSATANERVLDHASAGRVRVNARDHLVFSKVWDSDANIYSCWQDDVLAGEVRLEIWSGGSGAAGRVLLLLAIGGAFYTLRILSRTQRMRRRRL